jgi:adenosylhomocysteine nucleosidase
MDGKDPLVRAREIGLVAALLRECRGILSWSGWKELKSGREGRVFELRHGEKRITLLVAGMGPKRAKSSAKFLVEEFCPEVLVCVGFCGALDPSLRVGEVVEARELFIWRGPGRLDPGPRIVGPALHRPLKAATMVSCLEFVAKRKVSEDLQVSSFPGTVDLESSFVAEVAYREGKGFFAIKAVSDEAELDPSTRVNHWVDSELRIRPSRVLLSLLKRPTWLADAWRLFLRSKIASVNLGESLRDLLFPGSEIRRNPHPCL